MDRGQAGRHCWRKHEAKSQMSEFWQMILINWISKCVRRVSQETGNKVANVEGNIRFRKHQIREEARKEFDRINEVPSIFIEQELSVQIEHIDTHTNLPYDTNQCSSLSREVQRTVKNGTGKR